MTKSVVLRVLAITVFLASTMIAGGSANANQSSTEWRVMACYGWFVISNQRYKTTWMTGFERYQGTLSIRDENRIIDRAIARIRSGNRGNRPNSCRIFTADNSSDIVATYNRIIDASERNGAGAPLDLAFSVE